MVALDDIDLIEGLVLSKQNVKNVMICVSLDLEKIMAKSSYGFGIASMRL